MALGSNSSRRLHNEDLVVDESVYPDWVSGEERLPSAGEQVFCTGGLAEVSRVLGKTGSGSRLLELHLLDDPKHPFFVAASNIRVPPVPQVAAGE